MKKHESCDKHSIQKCGFCHTCIKWEIFDAIMLLSAFTDIDKETKRYKK